MNTRHLEEFLLFTEDLNFSTAAKKLYITRPTLSEHLSELESDLGCKLIERNKNRPSLTPAGKRFVQTATDLLNTIESIQDEYHNLSENLLTVSIAATNLPWVENLFYKTRRTIQSKFPTKHIDLITTSGPSSTLEALFDGSNDIVIAGFKKYLDSQDRLPLDKGIQGFHICTEPIKLLMTQDNPLFNRSDISITDMNNATLLLPPDIYDAYLRDGMVEQFAQQGAHISLVPAQVNDHFEYFAYNFGQAFGVVPTTLIPRFGIEEREECRVFSLSDLPIFTDFYLVYRDEFVQNENGRLLIEEMRALVENTEKQAPE